MSLFAHGLVSVVILLAASQTIKQKKQMQEIPISRGLLRYSPETQRPTSNPSLGTKAGGGRSADLPATSGFFLPRSPIALATPKLPDNDEHLLPVIATILDAQAPSPIIAQNEVGLPWMTERNNSAGPGSNGIGAGKEGGMGDREGSGGGDGGEGQPYAIGMLMPACLVCPLPVYTDEARHAKMQGTVTLRVLVGLDGKASNIRVIRGVGMGLDERAVKTVNDWKFRPAKDAHQHAVAAWVTIEVVFRLF